MKLVEGVAGVWHYHISETGQNGQPALCGVRLVMATSVPFSHWGLVGGHLRVSYCRTCDRLLKTRRPT